MGNSKSTQSNGEYMMSYILKGTPNAEEVRESSDSNDRATILEVLNANGDIIYLIRKVGDLKHMQGPKIAADAIKEIKLTRLLNKSTPYVEKILDVKTYEFPLVRSGPTYLMTELLIEYPGRNLLHYRANNELTIYQFK